LALAASTIGKSSGASLGEVDSPVATMIPAGRTDLLAPRLPPLKLRRQSATAVVVPVLIVLDPVQLVHLRQDLRDLVSQLGLGLHHPLMAHRLRAGRVRPDLRPVDRQPAKLGQPKALREAHALHQHRGKVLPVPLPKPVDRPEVRPQLARQVPEPQVPEQPPRDLAPAVHPCDCPEQPIRGGYARSPSTASVVRTPQIEPLDHVVHEEHRVRRIEWVANEPGQ
jgi:hypothetical protein